MRWIARRDELVGYLIVHGEGVTWVLGMGLSELLCLDLGGDAGGEKVESFSGGVIGVLLGKLA